jgi:hypothetical protein
MPERSPAGTQTVTQPRQTRLSELIIRADPPELGAWRAARRVPADGRSWLSSNGAARDDRHDRG